MDIVNNITRITEAEFNQDYSLVTQTVPPNTETFTGLYTK